MQIESLADMPLIDAVLDMQRALSQARDENELVYGFAKRINKISGVTEILDVAVCDPIQSSFRVMDRLIVTDPNLSLENVRNNSYWDADAKDVPVISGGLVGKIIQGTVPKIARDVHPASDPVLDGWITGPRDALAVPVFYEGNITQWLILFREPGLPLDPVHLRAGIAMFNMLSRGVYQLKLTRQITALHKQLEGKLEEVARIQRSLLPTDIPEHPALDMAVSYRPSDVASGDYYGFRDFDDGAFGIAMADVAGHGPAAAVVMTMLRTAMSIWRNLNLPGGDVVRDINRFMWDSLTDGTFVTAFFLRIHPMTGHVLYANAGHCPPLLRKSDGSFKWLDEEVGPPLGVLPEIETPRGEFILESGDTIILYTDGITEAFNPAKELFGETRLEETVREASGSALAILQAIVKAVDTHAAGRQRIDDQCLLAVQYRGEHPR